MHIVSRALLLPLIAALMWVGGLYYYVAQMPIQPTQDERMADAIVVLTGGRGRLEHGLKRLAEGKAAVLFVSGVAKGVTIAELLHGHDLTTLAPKIALGFEATSTVGNASETAKWLKAQNFHTIRLVTASYHMPRALREFTETMPELIIIPDPIFPDDFDRIHWWQHETSLKFAISEFHKFIGSKLRHALLSDKTGP